MDSLLGYMGGILEYFHWMQWSTTTANVVHGYVYTAIRGETAARVASASTKGSKAAARQAAVHVEQLHMGPEQLAHATAASLLLLFELVRSRARVVPERCSVIFNFWHSSTSGTANTITYEGWFRKSVLAFFNYSRMWSLVRSKPALVRLDVLQSHL